MSVYNDECVCVHSFIHSFMHTFSMGAWYLHRRDIQIWVYMICVCVCVYVCVYAYIHASIHTHVHQACTYTYIMHIHIITVRCRVVIWERILSCSQRTHCIQTKCKCITYGRGARRLFPLPAWSRVERTHSVVREHILSKLNASASRVVETLGSRTKRCPKHIQLLYPTHAQNVSSWFILRIELSVLI